MARHALMSPGHFSRAFRAAYGETPYSYLMTRRVERAMALLPAGMSVTDACRAVGCTSLGSFSSRFTELVGMTPSAYRAASTPPPSFSVGRMTISLQYCHITVNDLDESLAFYRDALGLEVHNDVASTPCRNC
jgi:AraC-like DNA-binding protein